MSVETTLTSLIKTNRHLNLNLNLNLIGIV